MTEATLNITPLHATHKEMGAKMVPFAGWEMPIQYTGIMEEHKAVREKVGIFDISHMGQFFISGEKAPHWLNTLLTNNVEKLEIGQGQYTFLLNERGGVIDDLMIYRVGKERFFMVPNAALIEDVYAWMQERMDAGVSLSNQSDAYGAMAIQGPLSERVYEKLFSGSEKLPPRFQVSLHEHAGGEWIVCRTGYTGEDGFELFCPENKAAEWFKKILPIIEELGGCACGLGARDTLRLEVCYPLNGSDLSPQHTPLQVGYGFAVDLTKENFVGKEVLLKQKEEGLTHKLAHFQMIDKGPPPRAHYPLYVGDQQIGELTSAGLSPSLGMGIGMGYVPIQYAKIDTEVDIDVRGRRFKAKVVKKPFYRKA